MKNLLAAIVLSMIVFPAFADEAGRSLPFSTVLVGLDGKPMTDPPGIDANGKPIGQSMPITLEMVAEKALIGVLDEDRDDPRTGRQGTPAQIKFDRAELVHKIRENPNAKLTIENISDIKTRIGRAYGPEIVWAAYNLLEPRGDTAKK